MGEKIYALNEYEAYRASHLCGIIIDELLILVSAFRYGSIEGLPVDLKGISYLGETLIVSGDATIESRLKGFEVGSNIVKRTSRTKYTRSKLSYTF